MLSIASLLRLVLIVTLYLYETKGHSTVIDLIHHDVVWIYLICWVVESFHDFCIFIREIFNFVEAVCREERKKLKEKSIK